MVGCDQTCWYLQSQAEFNNVITNADHVFLENELRWWKIISESEMILKKKTKKDVIFEDIQKKKHVKILGTRA